MSRYLATVTRESRWWIITVDGFDGVTQARRVAEVEHMARDFVATWLDADYDLIEVDLHYDIPGLSQLDDRMSSLRADRAEARRLESTTAEATGRLAQELVDADVPLRDAGELLGVSYQRIHQLTQVS